MVGSIVAAGNFLRQFSIVLIVYYLINLSARFLAPGPKGYDTPVYCKGWNFPALELTHLLAAFNRM